MAETAQKKIGGGLAPLPKDERDLQFGALYRLPKLDELPSDFVVAEPLEIRDQGDNDRCTAYAVMAVSEDQEGVVLDVDYQFGATKDRTKDYEAWGANLREACMAHVKRGALEREYVDSILSPGQRMDREFIVEQWENWGLPHLSLALKHKKASVMAISGSYDLFDNIRATVWKNRKERRSVASGVKWHDAWTDLPGGIIKENTGHGDYGHAFKISGWKTINGEIYLVAVLSNGTDIGDGGIFYLSRSVVNAECIYGNFTFKDADPAQAKLYQANGYRLDGNWLQSVTIFFKKLFQTL